MHFYTLFKQPKFLWPLACGELWNTFSYYGTQTILALYFLHIFHLTRNDSYLLYGAYAAFAYSIPILGGIVADKWLGSKNAVIIGSCLNILGNLILMSFHHYYLFCLGLATSLIGSSLYKSNATHLVGTLYLNRDIKKESGFTLLYLAINVGGVLGPLIYGLVAHFFGWNYGFLCSALGILISTIWFISNPHQWEDRRSKTPTIPLKMLLYISILVACLLLSLPFYILKITNLLIIGTFIISILYLIVSITKYHGEDRRHLLALLLISFFSMFYFAAGLQIGTTITLFIQSKIQQGIIKTQLPASTFSTFYPLFVLVLAPFFTPLWHGLKRKGFTVNTPNKLLIGIILAALGISIFALTALTNFVITGILLGNLFLSAGELALAPAIYTAVSDLSPGGMKSTMMGCMLLFIAFGGYLSSLLATASHVITRVIFAHQPEYFGEFTFIAGFTFLIALILIAFTSKLSKMMS